MLKMPDLLADPESERTVENTEQTRCAQFTAVEPTTFLGNRVHSRRRLRFRGDEPSPPSRDRFRNRQAALPCRDETVCLSVCYSIRVFLTSLKQYYSRETRKACLCSADPDPMPGMDHEADSNLGCHHMNTIRNVQVLHTRTKRIRCLCSACRTYLDNFATAGIFAVSGLPVAVWASRIIRATLLCFGPTINAVIYRHRHPEVISSRVPSSDIFLALARMYYTHLTSLRQS